jgi:hypothetical protein
MFKVIVLDERQVGEEEKWLKRYLVVLSGSIVLKYNGLNGLIL